MRRRKATLALAMGMVLLLAGCGQGGGLDGDLVDDWAALPVPGPFTPPAGECHQADFAATVSLADYSPVACDTPHRLETVHVGNFPAARATPPTPGSAELRAAFADCDAQAVGYLGADWRAGRLWLGVAVPSAQGWSVGSRWYRCDVAELTDVEANGVPVTRTGSLRGALAEGSPLRLGCQHVKVGRYQRVDRMVPVDCATAHNGEFVGVWRATVGSYPTKSVDWLPLYAGCRSTLARFVQLPDDAELRFRAAVVVRLPTAARWRDGDRGMRCYLWLSDRTVTASLRSAGPNGLPMRTR